MSEAQRALGMIPLEGEIVKEKSPAEKLAESTKIAMQIAEEHKYSKFDGIHSYDMEKIKPTDMALLLEALPLGYTFPQALMVAIEAQHYGLDVFRKDVYPVGGGVGFTVEAEAKIAKKLGYNLSIPTYEHVSRDWPANKKLMLKGSEHKLPKDLGCICRMTINGTPVEAESWYSEHAVTTNINWVEHPKDMLEVRSHGRAIAKSTGVGESQDIIDPETGERPSVKTIAPVAPKEIPTGIQK